MESNGVQRTEEISVTSNQLLRMELSQWWWRMGLICILRADLVGFKESTEKTGWVAIFMSLDLGKEDRYGTRSISECEGESFSFYNLVNIEFSTLRKSQRAGRVIWANS